MFYQHPIPNPSSVALCFLYPHSQVNMSVNVFTLCADSLSSGFVKRQQMGWRHGDREQLAAREGRDRPLSAGRMRLVRSCFLIRFRLPTSVGGSSPELYIRGLLSVNFRCGLHARQVARATLYTEGSDGFVASTAASIATGWSEVPRRDLHPLWTSASPRHNTVTVLSRTREPRHQRLDKKTAECCNLVH